MIIVTPIELLPEVYRFYIHQAEKQPDTTPEEIISEYLTNYANEVSKRKHSARENADCK